MRWFKHLVDSGDDPDILEAIELFGSYGYYVFFRTLEIMGREFKIKTPGYNDFSIEFLSKKYQKTWKKTEKVLLYFKSKKRIFFKIYREKNGRKNQLRIKLNCPKLRKQCDEYTDKRIKGKMKKRGNKNRDILMPKIGSKETEHRTQKQILLCVNQPGAGLDFLERIIFKCETVREFSEKYKKKINIYAWVQTVLNENGHPKAVDESLDALIKKWVEGNFVSSPWPYLMATFKLKNGNYWEEDHIRESQKFKDIWIEDEAIQEMVGKIGKEIEDPNNPKEKF